jgi:hypothetical protein
MIVFSDGELVAEVKRLAECESYATARLIAALAELDARRLYLGQGCSSMFTYCTQVLHLDGVPRISPRRAVRSRWRHHGRQPGAPLRCAQPLRSGAVLR